MVCIGRILCLKSCLGVDPFCQLLTFPWRWNSEWIAVPAALTAQPSSQTCLHPVCDSHAVLQQVQMLSFFSGENIMVAVFSGMGGKIRPYSAKWPVWKIDVVNMVSRPLWNMIKIDLKLIKPIFHILRTCFTLYLTHSYIFDFCACGSVK